jgi:hypothetical protein
VGRLCPAAGALSRDVRARAADSSPSASSRVCRVWRWKSYKRLLMFNLVRLNLRLWGRPPAGLRPAGCGGLRPRQNLDLFTSSFKTQGF